MTDKIRFTIYGAPRTKKTSNRAVHVQGKLRILPSKAHEVWYHNAVSQAYEIKAALRHQDVHLPITAQVSVRAIFYRQRNDGDRLNYEQALYDWLEGVGIIKNDRQIYSGDGTRLRVDRERPRIEVEIEVEK